MTNFKSAQAYSKMAGGRETYDGIVLPRRSVVRMFLNNFVLGFLLGALVATAAFRAAGFRIQVGGQQRLEQPRNNTDTMRVEPEKRRPRGGIA